MKRISPRLLFAAIGVSCFALVFGGVVMTRWLHLEPCPLCIFQRVLYLLVGLFALVAAAWARGARWLGALALLSSLGGFATAAYQSWMQAFPARFMECGGGIPTTPIEKLVDWLGRLVPSLFYAWGECTSREWVFLKLSLANWSVLLFLGFSALLALLLLRRRVR